MTPLTFMPSAPPSRPVAPVGGGVADTPSSSSFESALQRAGADDDSPRAQAPRSNATPDARQTSDEPPTSAAPVKKARNEKAQDDKTARRADASTDADTNATDAKPARTRDASLRDTAPDNGKSKDAPKEPSADAVVAASAVSVAVPVQAPAPVVATDTVDVTEKVAATPAAGLSEVSGFNSARTLDTTLVARKAVSKAENLPTPSAKEPGEALKLTAEPEAPATKSTDSLDVEARSAEAAKTAGQPAVVSHAQAPRLSSSQAARSLLADVLQRAAPPSGQSTQPAPDARPVAAAAAEVAAPAATPVTSSAPAAVANENAPVVKAAGKNHTPAPAVQDINVPAVGTSQQEGASAGNGGTSWGSGRRDNAPASQAKSDTLVSWPTAFAVRVPEAMSSSLERTGAAAPTLPSAVTQQDLSNVGPQLVRGLQLQAHAGGGDVKMTLNPEHLGSVTIEVQVRHDRVSATLTAETLEVRQWIATHQADLKNSLAGVGLTLEDLVVKDESGGGRQDARGEEQSQSRRRQPAPEESDAQFEVLV